MSECFDIVTSGAIPTEPLRRYLASVLPGREVVVALGVEEVPEPCPAVWVRVVGTADPDWPCMLQFSAFPSNSPLGRHPDLRLAEALAELFGVRSLCDTHGLVPGLDQHDPYWFLAWADGGWHLADASGTPLVGPYTDGTNTFRGDLKVRLKQRMGPLAD